MGAFPAFLRAAFDEIDLVRMPSSVAVVDAEGRILWTNPAWHAFAAEDSERWRSYFDAIAPPLRAFYERAFADALRTGEIFEQEYECSTPEHRRLYRVRALPILRRVLLVEHALVADELCDDRRRDPPPERDYRNMHGFLVQCSNCRRTRHPESAAYHWVSAWAERCPPGTSHGICPPCAGFYWGLVND